MTDSERRIILKRNKEIIYAVLNEIEKTCPNSVDLIGIGGSFCNGDFYEKSDLDLLIVRNDDSAKAIEKCFILDDVGFDIYTQGWDRVEALSQYDTPYVTKLFDLKIIYFRNQEVLNRYKSIQSRLKNNMSNDDLVKERIECHFCKCLEAFEQLKESNNMHNSYMSLFSLMKEIEAIIYFINRTYVKSSAKNIPQELSEMKILPEDFNEIYSDITNCDSKEKVEEKAAKLIRSIQVFLSSFVSPLEVKTVEIEYQEKQELKKENLIGTYEEIFSNWRNKMYLASKTSNRYLSFVTMSSCQQFYDEMAQTYNIPSIELIEKYNPKDLKSNAVEFDKAMGEWKKLYDSFGLQIQSYSEVSELEKLYKKS